MTRYLSTPMLSRALAALLTLGAFSATAQKSAQAETPQIITFTAAESLRADKAAQILAERLKLNAATDELRSVYTQQPGNGVQVQRFNQYFKDVRVAHGTYTLTSKNGLASFATGKFYPVDANTSVAPKITEAAALAKAIEATGAQKYMWEHPAGSSAGSLGKRNTAPKGTLTLIEDFTGGIPDGVLHLAYAFDIYAAEPVSRCVKYIDAQSGKLLFSNSILTHVASTGASLYSGTVGFQSSLISGGLYAMRDVTRGSGVNTYSLANTTGSTVLDVTSTTTTFSTNAAIDAHWGAEKVYDYWRSAHNRYSWDGLDGVLESYVHYSTNYDNAFWDGEEMVYGDGSGGTSGLSPLTSLDVC